MTLEPQNWFVIKTVLRYPTITPHKGLGQIHAVDLVPENHLNMSSMPNDGLHMSAPVRPLG